MTRQGTWQPISLTADQNAKTQAEFDKIEAKLDVIEKDLSGIDHKLDHLVEALAALQVHLDDKIDAQWRDLLVARIKGIKQHYRTWTSGLGTEAWWTCGTVGPLPASYSTGIAPSSKVTGPSIAP